MEQTLLLQINGMHCGACVRRVTTVLSNLPGVYVDDVSIGSAKVRLDPVKTAPQSVADAVNRIGFEASLRGG